MTRSELESALNAKFARVMAPVMVREDGSIRTYRATVFDVAGDTAIETNILFYVQNEGAGNEVAFWKQREPKPAPVETFAKKIQDRIAQAIAAQAQVGGETLHAAFIGEVDARNERAKVTIITESGGTYTERQLVAWLNQSDQLQHALIS